MSCVHITVNKKYSLVTHTIDVTYNVMRGMFARWLTCWKDLLRRGN